jgi:Domain of unknown function (DUF4192)
VTLAARGADGDSRGMESALDVPPLREVVAHAWFTMGYAPTRSLVLVGVESSGSCGFVARVDLPRPEYRRAVANIMAAAARRAALRSLVVLVVLDPGGEAAPLLDRAVAALVKTLRSRLRQAGVAVLDVAVVSGGRYRSLDCADPGCCPPLGRSLGDLRTTTTAASMVVRGRTLVDDETALVEDVAPRAWPENVELPAGSRNPATDLRRWRDLVAARLAPDGGGPEPGPEDVAWLVPALEDSRFRDAALVSLLPGGARLAGALARGAVTGPPSFQECEQASPDPEVFEAGRVLLAAVARGAPAGRRAEALAVLAWMSWWQGVGTRSRLLAALALRDRPGHRLAGLVDSLLVHGVPPGWVRLDDGARASARKGWSGAFPGEGCGPGNV